MARPFGRKVPLFGDGEGSELGRAAGASLGGVLEAEDSLGSTIS